MLPQVAQFDVVLSRVHVPLQQISFSPKQSASAQHWAQVRVVLHHLSPAGEGAHRVSLSGPSREVFSGVCCRLARGLALKAGMRFEHALIPFAGLAPCGQQCPEAHCVLLALQSSQLQGRWWDWGAVVAFRNLVRTIRMLIMVCGCG